MKLRICALLLLLPTLAGAALFDNDAGDNVFENPINWDTNTTPGPGEIADVSNGFTANTTYVGPVNPAIAPNEIWSGESGTGSVINVAAGTTTGANNWIAVGRNGEGTMNVAANTIVATDRFSIGSFGGGDGTLNITGANAQVGSQNRFLVGERGTAEVNQSAGTVGNGGEWFSIGNNPGSNGTYNISGGTLATGTDFNIGDQGGSTGVLNISGAGLVQSPGNTFIGKNGTGTLNISGGTFEDFGGNETTVGTGAAGRGFINMSGGELNSDRNFQIGASGYGELNMSGGTVNDNGWLAVGRFNNSEGHVDMTGGTVRQTAGGAGTLIAEQGVGTLTIGDGATFESLGQFIVGHQQQSDGTVTVEEGGILRVGEVSGTSPATANVNLIIGNNGNTDAEMNVNGGTVTVSNELWVGQGGVGGGETDTPTLNITGGSVSSNSWLVVGRQGNRGEVNLSGDGELLHTGPNHIIVGSLSGQGEVNISDTARMASTTGELRLGENGGGSGTVNQGGGTVEAAALRVGWTGTGAGDYTHTGGTASFGSGELVANSVSANLDSGDDINIGLSAPQTGDVNFATNLNVNGGTATAQQNLIVGTGGTFLVTQNLNIGMGDPAGAVGLGNLNILGGVQVDSPSGGNIVAGNVNVGGGQKLGGDGGITVGGATNISGGVLAPGSIHATNDAALNNDPRGSLDLITTQLDLASGAAWAADIDGANTDILNLFGVASLTDATLAPGLIHNPGASATPGDITSGTYNWLLNNDGSDPIGGTNYSGFGTNGEFVGTFLDADQSALYPGADTFLSLGKLYAVFYNADFATGALTGGNDILLINIPEPSRAVLLAMGLFAVVLRRRR